MPGRSSDPPESPGTEVADYGVSRWKGRPRARRGATYAPRGVCGYVERGYMNIEIEPLTLSFGVSRRSLFRISGRSSRPPCTAMERSSGRPARSRPPTRCPLTVPRLRAGSVGSSATATPCSTASCCGRAARRRQDRRDLGRSLSGATGCWCREGSRGRNRSNERSAQPVKGRASRQGVSRSVRR